MTGERRAPPRELLVAQDGAGPVAQLFQAQGDVEVDTRQPSQSDQDDVSARTAGRVKAPHPYEPAPPSAQLIPRYFVKKEEPATDIKRSSEPGGKVEITKILDKLTMVRRQAGRF